jgi:hypothetical protein
VAVTSRYGSAMENQEKGAIFSSKLEARVTWRLEDPFASLEVRASNHPVGRWKSLPSTLELTESLARFASPRAPQVVETQECWCFHLERRLLDREASLLFLWGLEAVATAGASASQPAKLPTRPLQEVTFCSLQEKVPVPTALMEEMVAQ